MLPLADTIAQALAEARERGASVNERLQVIVAAVRARNPAIADAVDRLVARLRSAGAGSGAPGPGDRMPGFILPDESGRLVSLDHLLTAGPVAIAFHRGHWCPYCRTAASVMAEMAGEIARAGGRLVSIVPERQPFARALKDYAASPSPVLVDMDNGYALSLGLAVWLGEEMTSIYTRAGYNVPRYQGNEAWTVPIPATFVVSTKGIIVARHLDPDYRHRMEVHALLAAFRLASPTASPAVDTE